MKKSPLKRKTGLKKKTIKKHLPKDYELDKLCSEVVRRLNGGFCKRCWILGRQDKPKDWHKMHWAHFRPRRYKRTRWIVDNATSLCCGCHRLLDDDSVEKDEFFRRILGQTRFQELYFLSLSTDKKDMPDRAKIKENLMGYLEVLR